MKIASLDWETYSEAGYDWDGQKWAAIGGKGQKGGIAAVGAYAYAAHPSTEILCGYYDLFDREGPRLWLPSFGPPIELLNHVKRGGIIKAYNSFFEWCVWNLVGVDRLGWDVALPIGQTIDTMAKALCYGLPAKLKLAARVLNAENLKIDDGKRLINKFSKPRKPTKKNPAKRITLADDPEDATRLLEYCKGDVKAETAVDRMIPDLSLYESRVWRLDQEINARGVKIDIEMLKACQNIVGQAERKYTEELQALTSGAVSTVNELDKMKAWLTLRRVKRVSGLTVDDVAELMGRLPQGSIERRVLEIRSILGSASVKKLRAIENHLGPDHRLRNLFMYYGANRTGRFSGQSVQPHNLKSTGVAVAKCKSCERHAWEKSPSCPWCGGAMGDGVDWTIGAVEDAFDVISYGRLGYVERVFGDPLTAVGGCLRGLFVADEGKELICSDYSAIEAVVLAALAGEEWRLEVFRTHGKIYEMSASKITGIPFEEFIQYQIDHDQHHPMRKKVGKVAELASGFGGSIGAWKNFGAGDFMTEAEILSSVRAWRKASPAIVSFWYGLEDAAVSAILNPGQAFAFRSIAYQVHNDILHCLLPSGRILYYHTPRLTKYVNDWGREKYEISYMGYNTDSIKGPIGWIGMTTWGGKLTENVTQATARDILVNGLLNVASAGFLIVLHVHDEAVGEVDEGTGDLDKFNKLLTTLPAWAEGWPIKAKGWVGKRYRKD